MLEGVHIVLHILVVVVGIGEEIATMGKDVWRRDVALGLEGTEDGLHLFGTLVAAVGGGEAHLGGVADGVVHTGRQAHRLSVEGAAAEGEA